MVWSHSPHDIRDADDTVPVTSSGTLGGRAMRIVLAVLMVIYGVAHLVGFAAAWKLVPSGLPYRTTVLGGQMDLGDAGKRPRS